MIAAHIVATLLEDDFDPKDEIDALLPFGKWHAVHGIRPADVRAWFKQWGMKVTYLYKSKKHGGLTGSFVDAAKILSDQPYVKNERGEWTGGQAYWDRQEVDRLFQEFAAKFGPDIESNVWFDDQTKIGYFDLHNGEWMRQMRAKHKEEQDRRHGQKLDQERHDLWTR